MTKWLKLPSFGTDPLERWLPVRTSFDQLAYLFFSLAGSVLLISAAVVGDFTQWLVPVNQSVLLAGATGAGAAVLLLYVFRSPYLRQTGTPALLASALFWIVMTSVSMLRGYSLEACLLLYGPVVAATIVALNRPIIMKFLFIILLVSILIQIRETISGQYLFVVESWGEALDETTTSGISGILRAKGLFAGPTVAAAFCILCCALFPPSRLMFILLVAVAALTASRSAFLFAGVYVSALILFADRGRRFLYVGAGLLFVMIVVFAAENGLLGDRLARLLTFGLYDDNSNQTRLLFWNWSWDIFTKMYSDVERFLGAPRFTYDVFAASTESQPLQYLLDTGIIGFIGYTIALVYTWRATLRLGPHERASFLAIFAVSLVVPLYNQSGLNILFWTYAYGLWQRAATRSLPGAADRSQHTSKPLRRRPGL